MPTPFKDPNIEKIFEAYPSALRQTLLELRGRIFEISDATYGAGELEESLKWGQPSYVVAKRGSPIRLGVTKEGQAAIYAHCQTSLISDFKSLFGDDFTFDGNRAIHLSDDHDLPIDQLSLLIKSALTYHQA